MVDPPSRFMWSRLLGQSQSRPRAVRLVPEPLRSARRPPRFPDPRASQRDRGSATIWAVSVLLLVSAAVGCALIWVAAEATRHSAERAADSAALAAASAALRRLAMLDNSNPCIAAAKAAGQADAELVQCDCVPLDCTVIVRRSMPLLGPLAVRLVGVGSVEATSRAGPVGESGGDG